MTRTSLIPMNAFVSLGDADCWSRLWLLLRTIRRKFVGGPMAGLPELVGLE